MEHEIINIPQIENNNNNLQEQQNQALRNQINQVVEKANQDQRPSTQENESQKKFKNIFFSQSSTESSDKANMIRSILKVISIFYIVCELITLEVQCLFFNNCYGESYEMEYWLSQSIAPLGLIIISLTVGFYFSIEYIVKTILNTMIYVYVLLALILLSLGIYSIVVVKVNSVEKIQTQWAQLSIQSQVYYYNNSVQVLFDIYSYKMTTTGVFYIIYAIISFILAFLANKLTDSSFENWRPKLVSRISNDRAERLTKYYEKYHGSMDKVIRDSKIKIDDIEKLNKLKPSQINQEQNNIEDKTPIHAKHNSSRAGMIENNEHIRLPNKQDSEKISMRVIVEEDSVNNKQADKNLINSVVSGERPLRTLDDNTLYNKNQINEDEVRYRTDDYNSNAKMINIEDNIDESPQDNEDEAKTLNIAKPKKFQRKLK